jgi:hypothetical protein
MTHVGGVCKTALIVHWASFEKPPGALIVQKVADDQSFFFIVLQSDVSDCATIFGLRHAPFLLPPLVFPVSIFNSSGIGKMMPWMSISMN